MSQALNYIFSVSFLQSIFRVTTPILFAALGSVVAERAGTSNIALEAIMLFSALAGALGSGLSSAMFSSVAMQTIFGFAMAIFFGVLISAILAFFSLKLKTDIVLAGIALNLMATGGTVFFMYSIIQDKGNTSSIATRALPTINIPGLENIPVIGGILSGHNILTYIAFICVPLLWIFLFRTKLGMRIRAVGENPGAAASVGVKVVKTQASALLISGFLASLGGAFMSMGYMNGFSQNMVAGRGFIALAAASMGQLHPVWTMVASLIFGLSDAISNVLAALAIPDEFVKVIPYITTVIGLVIFSIMENRKKIARKSEVEGNK